MKVPLLFLAVLLPLATTHAAEVGVRIRFGLKDQSNTKWDGTVSVAPGKVAAIDGWRFQQTDKVIGTTGWQASTRPLAQRRSNNPGKAGKAAKKGNAASLLADNGVILLLDGVNENSVVSIKSEPGAFEFKLSDIPYGKVIEKLEGAVDIERVAASRPLTSQRTDDDFPAITVAADGTSHVAYISFTPGLDRDERARTWTEAPKDFSFLAQPTGGDQLWLRSQKSGRWSEPVAITAGKGDLYKCAVAIDGQSQLWVVWAERKGDNFDIWARPVKDGKPGQPVQLSSDKGNDISPVATTDGQGRVWIAWQGARNGAFAILAKRQLESGWSPEMRVSPQKGNCWQPAIAAAKDGRVAIGWDTYDRGDYDIWAREYDATGKALEPRPLANTDQYEARAALTYDLDGRLWVCWEESGQTWGKDWGAYERNTGIGLYRNRQIGMAVLKDGNVSAPVQSLTKALASQKPRKRMVSLPARRPEPEATTRKAGEEAEAEATGYNNLARIVCDRDNRIWMIFRSREGSFHTPLGSVWMNYTAYFDGQQWVGPTLLPHSDNLLYNLPAVVAHPGGGLLAAHSSDHRQDRHVTRGGLNNASLDSDNDPFDNDVFVSRIEFEGGKVNPSLAAAVAKASPSAQPTAYAAKEQAEVARIRAYRSDVGGQNLRILRGEFHRHTEISGDGGNDGPLEDMWRYGLDAAAMDWIGNGDHDNGGGREYTWWLTQKTTDAFHIPGVFDPLFTYERSVRYPEGHRNVVFVQRGVRTLPRLPISARDFKGNAPDTQMLYKYLRHFDGVCAMHTSATSMGTDWRDWDPVVEPMVEIYQGARQNYERPGAPRCPTENDAIGGWEPLGFVNLALLKGHRFSFQSSSDHGSTHISYCLVYAEDSSREAIHKAMKLRHTYGATDNIIADYRCKAGGREYMMGDEFSTGEAPTLRLKLIGTAPFARVTLVKDDVELKVWEPGKAEVELVWTDPKPEKGKTSYYYFRGEQAKQGTESNGELVWVSPMWITYTGQ
jgi:hypothetical protein